jgi:hypothetical protein
MALVEEFRNLMKVQTSADFHFNDEQQWVEVAGIKYAYQFFKELGMAGMAEGQEFRILKRAENGYLEIQRFYNEETSNARG